ncbi:hypothetical protein EY650_10310 [Enterococcus faecalis]|nr:hypothetical protein [Enterococcus faecalis]ETU49661.1 hypothetical protein P021_00789 [Enterococcus faecalis EnGen0421]CWJ70526.1 Uncharacterised protein [Streptococcus pneumoniae]SJN52116.1 hypothetical protein FM120_34095 [Sphingobacterium faecium PCAi_F2.5]EOJ43171.1 hypothetical protein UOC_00929 [Enterococcus faecalis EnGen0289]EOL16882.1 hypothetical protein WU1_01084 [Enterococcus faecalis EnGen0327]
MQVYLDNQQFTNKPKNSEIGIITNKIYKQRANLDLRELAKEIAEKGRTVMLATYVANLKQSELEQQSLLMLDFDNQDKDNQFTLEQALNDKFIKANACFIYRTFSDSKVVDKFRVVFALDSALESTEEVTRAYKTLLAKYTQADRHTSNPNRLFFGSNNGFIEIDFNNRLKKSEVVKEVLEVKEKVKKYKVNIPKKFEIIDNTNVYDLIKDKKFKQAKEIIAIKYSNTNVLNNQFKNETSVNHFFKTEVDMLEFLDLPSTKSFNCIVFEDNKPSSGIYISETGTQIYHNFANNYRADLVRLVAKLADITAFEAIELLMYLTDSQLVTDTLIQRQIRTVDYLISSLENPDLSNLYPTSYKFLSRNLEEITSMLKIVSEYKYIDSSGNVKIMSYLTVDSLTKQINHRVKHKNVSKETVVKCMYLLTLTDILIKEKIENVDKQLLENIDKSRAKSNNETGLKRYKRYPNFLSIADNADLETVESILKELNSKKFTVEGSLNFEWLYTNYSKEIALKVFPQKFDSEVKNITDNLVISNDSTKKIEMIMSVIHTYLIENDTNYIKNSILVELLKENKFPKVQKNLTKFRNKVVLEYSNYYSQDLAFDKISNDLKEQLCIDKSTVIKGNIFYLK